MQRLSSACPRTTHGITALAIALAPRVALATPLERSRVTVPTLGGGFQQTDDLFWATRILSRQRALFENALNRFRSDQFFHERDDRGQILAVSILVFVVVRVLPGDRARPTGSGTRRGSRRCR